jgi:hypothetical protein
MAIIIKSENPQILLKKIKSKINEGDIRTWLFDNDGDFTHTAEQYNEEAWFRPNILEKEIIFNFITYSNLAVYNIYAGRLVEMLIGHFTNDILKIIVTPKITIDEGIIK